MVKCRSKTPYPIRFKLIRGRTYYYCTCGKSKDQPFCDGRHKNTEYSPITYQATEDKVVVFCGCKLSTTKPFCDGTHTKIDQDAVSKIIQETIK